MATDTLITQIIALLEDNKANDIVTIDVKELTDVTDAMIIASGTSTRHVSAVANKVLRGLKEQGIRPNGVQGLEGGEWVLIDYVDCVVHVMQPDAREHYQLEQLWDMAKTQRELS